MFTIILHGLGIIQKLTFKYTFLLIILLVTPSEEKTGKQYPQTRYCIEQTQAD